ncbi:MAG TPA: c-type cytochrome [Rhodanobacteraceae bacterium]|nr:c-type cytochrome [Rhodanobacteraceae bacterium]
MKRHTEHVLVTVAVLVAIAVGLGIFAYSGLYNIGSDDHHWRLTYNALQTVRDRSIQARSKDIEVPDLNDPQLILKGAGQYAAMCTGCHLTPGQENSELREGMYPQPPNLSKVRVDPQDAFWVIKHGIKMSGMPAWGKVAGHDDPTIWSMVAFIEKLPDMTPEQYKEIVAKAPPDEDMDMGGHSHSHNESADHPDATETQGMAGTEMGQGKTSAGDTQAMLKPGAAPDAEAAAQAFQEALKRGDRDVALALLTPDAQISEGGETQSRDDYAAHHLAEDIAFLKNANVKLLSRASMSIGDSAQVASESEISVVKKGKPLTLRNREVMDVKRVNGTWKIAAIRWDSQQLRNAREPSDTH